METTSVTSDDTEYSVLAFYGIDLSTKTVENFYTDAIKYFEYFGCSVDKVVVCGDGFSGRYTTLRRTHLKLQKFGFSTVTSFYLYSIKEGKDPINDYIVEVIYRKERGRHFVSIAVQSEVASLKTQLMVAVAKSAIQSLKPAYGIGFKRNRKDGPSFYVVGISRGGGSRTEEEYEKELHDARWGDIGMVKQVYINGIIRDVYPWNFLTTSHLKARVNDSSLQHWIQQDPSRGSLSSIGNSVWLWEVLEPNIPIVRSTLWNTGIIFNWRNYL